MIMNKTQRITKPALVKRKWGKQMTTSNISRCIATFGRSNHLKSIPDPCLRIRASCIVAHRAVTIGSLSNHDDSNINPTNLHIWQRKTVFLHALHVHFLSFDILLTFAFFLRRKMTCFGVVWTTWAYDDKCSILSSHVPSAGSNLIPGWLEHIFQA